MEFLTLIQNRIMELLIKILTGTAFILFIGVFICWLIPSVEELEELDKKKKK